MSDNEHHAIKCTGSIKHQGRFSHSQYRSYRALTQRLEKMERLIEESMRLPTSQMRREYLHTRTSQFNREHGGSSPPSTQAPLRINLSSHQDRSISLDVKDRSGERLCIGSCSILSPEGIRWINALVGDESFSLLLSHLKIPRNPPTGSFEGRVDHPLPPHDMVTACFEEFSTTYNRCLHFFEDDYMTEILQRHLQGQPFLDATSYAALNMIVAHSLRKFHNMRAIEAEKYFDNAMNILSIMIMQRPNKNTIATILSMAMHLVYTSRNHPAATILGAAIQSIIMAGYHHRTTSDTTSTALHERRLLYYAFIFDQDLSMYLTKPASLTTDMLPCLPEEYPEDGLNTLTLEDGSTMNYLREQVILASIQQKVYQKLRSTQASAQSTEQLYASVMELDVELQNWRQNIPDLAQPQTPLAGLDEQSLMTLTVLHFCYFQLLVSIHSVVFSRAAPLPHECEENNLIISSVSLCVSAARASISLLNYHEQRHPFTIYLLYHVAWNVDILLINILENKTKPQAFDDLQLLGSVVSFFEQHDPSYETAVAYHITRLYYQVALRAVNNAKNAFQNKPQESPVHPPATASDNGHSLYSPLPNTSGNLPVTGTGSPLYDSNVEQSVLLLLSSYGMELSFLPDLWQDPHLSRSDGSGDQQSGV